MLVAENVIPQIGEEDLKCAVRWILKKAFLKVPILLAETKRVEH